MWVICPEVEVASVLLAGIEDPHQVREGEKCMVLFWDIEYLPRHEAIRQVD